MENRRHRLVEIIMFLEFDDLLVRGDKEELLKRLLNRCHAAVNACYEYEKAKSESFWRFDVRFYEQGIELLYERFSYAMAMIADRFGRECDELYNLSEASDKARTFVIFLGGAVDQVFKHSIRDMGLSDATMEYYMEDYDDDAYYEFWDSHKQLAAEVIAVRNSFHREERTFVHGFSDSDIENIVSQRGGKKLDKVETHNRDCLHVMRSYKRWGDVVVEKFLTNTKREYLPIMIRFFIAKPKHDIFAAKPSGKWWRFRKG